MHNKLNNMRIFLLICRRSKCSRKILRRLWHTILFNKDVPRSQATLLSDQTRSEDPTGSSRISTGNSNENSSSVIRRNGRRENFTHTCKKEFRVTSSVWRKPNIDAGAYAVLASTTICGSPHKSSHRGAILLYPGCQYSPIRKCSPVSKCPHCTSQRICSRIALHLCPNPCSIPISITFVSAGFLQRWWCCS